MAADREDTSSTAGVTTPNGSKKLSRQAFEEIRQWMHRNARPVELSVWKYEFERGSKEEVLAELAYYQNRDGGFGNGLEADSWNPHSSPYTTVSAIHILRNVNYTDTKHPIMQGIIRFLESGAYFSNDYWFFSVPSNNDYPHAPWWTFNDESNKVESIGVTAEIVSFILNFTDPGSSIYQKAMQVSHQLINKLKTLDNYGDMGIAGCCTLLDTVQQCSLADILEYDFLQDTLRKLVYESIEKDICKWVYYGVRPSNYITSPGSRFYSGNEAWIHQELDYLIDTKPGEDVWGINWSWFQNNEVYAKEFAISENWWKAAKAIEKTKLLRDFGRLDSGG
ncbi:hypothetical protein MKX42_21235 [Paenibacillus sp. FSL R7-0204]|uniref:hypothetical protein n=1 Tax=Paenibacillus sp. FSL R7-0204 TaxID=2921675 RepID=UPI0030F51609